MDKKTFSKLRGVLRRNRKRLLAFPNVRDVMAGLRVKGGCLSEEPVITLFVHHKVNEELIKPEFNMTGHLIEGFSVDILQYAREEMATRAPVLTPSFQSVQGGLPIRHMLSAPNDYGTLGIVGHATGSGTMGAAKDEPVFLSAGHVLAKSAILVYQGIVRATDGLSIGVCTGFLPAYDAAAAKLLPNIPFDVSIYGIGTVDPRPYPANRIFPGLMIKKFGARTHYREAVVSHTDGTGRRWVLYRPPGTSSNYEVSMPGDSGALWVTCDGQQAVLLHIAGESGGFATEFAIGSPIDPVLRTFGFALT